MEKVDIPKKKEFIEILRKNHVIFAAVFGSRAKGTAREDSDYDLLVEFDPDAHVGYFKFFDIEDDIKKTLNANVDLVTGYGLGRKSFRREVLSTMKVFYDRRKNQVAIDTYC